MKSEVKISDIGRLKLFCQCRQLADVPAAMPAAEPAAVNRFQQWFWLMSCPATEKVVQ